MEEFPEQSEGSEPELIAMSRSRDNKTKARLSAQSPGENINSSFNHIRRRELITHDKNWKLMIM